MGLRNLFTRKRSSATQAGQRQASQQEINQESENTEIGEDVRLISYITRMPIDLIYAYLKEDYETKGYEDALSNPDSVYKELNKSLIRSNLEILFKQVILRYEDDLRDIEYHIHSRTEAGLLNVAEQLKSRKATYGQHLGLLKDMENDLKNNAPYMEGMVFSYERGFLKGLAALSFGTFTK